MVAGTAVLLVVATVDLVRDDDAAPSGDTAQQVVGIPQPSATPTSTATPVRKKKRGKGVLQPASPTTTTPPAPEPADPVGACADSDIAMTPVMAPAVAGRKILVTLALRTREAEACTWTLSRESLAYKITDGDDDVWSSSECPGQLPEDEIVVRRDVTATYRMAWSGRTSSRDCPGSMRFVPPGDYAVQAAAIGGEPSAVVPFVLADPADVQPKGPIGPPLPEGVG